jgi:hypothetical protein
MRLMLLCALLLWPALMQAADLSKVDRAIKKEPTYKGKPKYCLLVFGPEAKTRVWLVLDGNTLYMDKNGNGDLTESGERFVGKQTKPSANHPDYPFSAFQEFALPDIEGQAAYHHIQVMHTLLKKEFGPKWRGNDGLKARLAQHPGLTRVGISLRINGKVRQQAVTDFADRPEKAPVVHFDGPLTFALLFAPVLGRGEKAGEIQVGLGTKGLGWDAFALLDYDRVPKAARPSAEVEFPPREPKEEPLRIQLALDRC